MRQPLEASAKSLSRQLSELPQHLVAEYERLRLELSENDQSENWASLHRELSEAAARRFLTMPGEERHGEFKRVGRRLTSRDLGRVGWMLNHPDRTPWIRTHLFPEMDEKRFKEQIDAITNAAARDARRFMLAQRSLGHVIDLPFAASSEAASFFVEQAKRRFSDIRPFADAVARELSRRLPVFPRPLQEEEASEHRIAFLRCYSLLDRIHLTLKEDLLDQLSQHRALAVLHELAPPPGRNAPAVKRTRAEKLLGLKDEPERKRQIRSYQERESQSEAFLRFVPWFDNSKWEEEEKRVHWLLVKASSRPALDFLCTWLKLSPSMHFSRSAAWREKVELRLAEASLARGRGAADEATYEIAWEILGLTSPEGRFNVTSTEERRAAKGAKRLSDGKIFDRVTTGRDWWMGGEGPAPLGSFRDAVFAWHFQDPDWWPVICKVMKAAQASHRGWLKRRLETQRLRVLMEAPPSRPDPHPGLEVAPKEGFSSAPAPLQGEGVVDAEPARPARTGLRGWSRS